MFGHQVNHITTVDLEMAFGGGVKRGRHGSNHTVSQPRPAWEAACR